MLNANLNNLFFFCFENEANCNSAHKAKNPTIFSKEGAF